MKFGAWGSFLGRLWPAGRLDCGSAAHQTLLGKGRDDQSGDIAIPDLIQLIYSSQPFGYDEATLNGILLDARRCNTRDDVTGALVCRQDIFLQLLEGPPAAVQSTFERIRRDDRHLEVIVRVSEPVQVRMFASWAMLHDPATTWMWTAQDISEGALDHASPADFRGVFERLADKVSASPTGSA